ncbi:MAG: hypothetical protein K2N18_05085, partial [Clostridia bacterium]|nr:hypothetical protein [Clostridia bacterium]
SLSENTECPFIIVLSADVKVITVVWNDIPSTGYVYNGLIQAPSLDNITVMFGDKDITDEVIGYLTLGGDVYTSKWAGTYKATLTLDEDSGYSIISGFETTYKIVRNQQGEGEKPAGADDPPTPNNGGNGGSGIKEFFEKLLASHFPLWQVATMAVAGLLALIFIIKAAQYGSRAKKANGEAKRIKSRAYAAFLPIFSTESVALGLSNQIWSIMAFAFIGLAVAMFVVAMIMRSSWKKAELAKENAIEERDERRFNGNSGQSSSEFKELKEQLAMMSTQQASAAAPSGDSMALIEEMRREMEQRRREDEERHRQEMDAMKMMFANMMGRQQGEDGFSYASMDDTDMLVQRVIAGLLPAVQQMMPEPTAYLAAPQEQNEELLNIVAEQNAQMQAMSAQMSELQAQLANMSQGSDAIIMPDSSEEIDALSAKMDAMQAQIANLGNVGTAVAYDNNNDEIMAEMNAMREQIEQLGNQSVTVVAADNSEEMKAMADEMNAMREQIAKLSESQYDSVILDDDEDDDFSFDDEEEWDCVLDEDDDDFVESVIVEKDGTVRKVYPNFRMRLKQSSDKNRDCYTAIKNLFC